LTLFTPPGKKKGGRGKKKGPCRKEKGKENARVTKGGGREEGLTLVNQNLWGGKKKRLP